MDRASRSYVAAGVVLLAGLWLAPDPIAPDTVVPGFEPSQGDGVALEGPAPPPPAKASPPSPGTRARRLAASGDPHDAYRAYRLIDRCLRARESEAACRGMGAAQLRSRLALLGQAARAGVPGAAAAWAGEGPFGDKSALTQRPDDPLVVEWVREAVEMIREAATRNDVAAITQLGWLTVHWDMGDAERLSALVSHAAEWETQAQGHPSPQDSAPHPASNP